MLILTCLLWIASPAIQIYLLTVLLRKNLRRDFPAFFNYTTYALACFFSEFSTYYASYKAYFCVYWVMTILGVGFGFMVIREVFYSIFRPYDSLKSLSQVLFKWVVGVLVLFSSVGILSIAHAGTLDHFMQVVWIFQRSVSVMQVGLVLFLLLFASMVGVTPRSYVFGIALGFGAFAIVNLLQATLYSAFGYVAKDGLNLLKSFAYTAACGVWAYYLRSPEPARLPLNLYSKSSGMEMHLALQTAGQSTHENFMPMIEHLVERVLEKRH